MFTVNKAALDESREGRIRALLNSGRLSHAQAVEVDEVAIHAIVSAMETLERVTATLPEGPMRDLARVCAAIGLEANAAGFVETFECPCDICVAQRSGVAQAEQPDVQVRVFTSIEELFEATGLGEQPPTTKH